MPTIQERFHTLAFGKYGYGRKYRVGAILNLSDESIQALLADPNADVSPDDEGGSGGSGVILPWVTATEYVVGQPVTNSGHTYLAVDDHTSGATFAGDLVAHWELLPFAVADVIGAAPLASPTLTGNPTAPTPAPGDNDTSIATSAFVKAALDALIASAPGTLDTLDELAAALGDDANFAATMTTALAGKAAKASNLSDLANASTARTNLGLGNVDNTSDTAKPVSTAQQTALDAKSTETVRTASGKGYVNHGATSGTTRPTGYASVEWVGSVSPTNAIDGDTWINTA